MNRSTLPDGGGKPALKLAKPSRDHHWTTAECADYLGVSPEHLEHVRCRGDGPPFYKIGRLVRYIPDAVEAWALARLVRSTSEARQK
jgi:Helix-turn-helix domain